MTKNLKTENLFEGFWEEIFFGQNVLDILDQSVFFEDFSAKVIQKRKYKDYWPFRGYFKA